MNNELFQQGIMNIVDARFVRDHFIPIALNLDRWNIVVYEAHRATELLWRGMICKLGHKPHEHHDIRRHIAYLLDRLPSERHSSIPFTIGVLNESGDGYGVTIDPHFANNVQLWMLQGNVYTLLACTSRPLPLEGQIDMTLEVNPPNITVYHNDTYLFSASSHSIPGPFTVIKKTFVRKPETERMRILKSLGDRLSSERDPAYYGEKQYNRDDALHAMSYMQQSFEAATTFFLFD